MKKGFLMSFKALIFEQQKGTYAAYKYSKRTEGWLNQFIDNHKLHEPNRDFHTTLLYSTVGAPTLSTSGGDINVSPVTFAGFEKFGAALVIKLDAPYMVERHKELMSKHPELVYDYDEYIPHITLSYDAEHIDTATLDASYFNGFEFEVVLEYHEALDLEWA
jgi:hypothetical protein